MPVKPQHVYLSPHLDDAVLSCGGCIHRQVQAGEPVLVVTIFAGRPDYHDLSPFAQELHARWGNPPDPVDTRRAEDWAALRRLGATPLHLEYLDCIYRRHPQSREWLYTSDAALFGPVHPAEQEWAHTLADILAHHPAIPAEATLYAPLAVDRHVDHQLVHRAARELLAQGRTVLFYEDYPYAEEPTAVEEAIANAPWQPELVPLSEEDVQARIEATLCYASQMGVLFAGAEWVPEQMREYMAALARGKGYAERFWRLRSKSPGGTRGGPSSSRLP